MQTPDEKMATTIANFKQWRETREHATKSTPISLQQQAVALLDDFSSCKVTKALNISGTNIRRWSGKPKNPTHGFVHLQPEPITSGTIQLELATQDGCQLRLSGDITPAHLAAITQSLQSPAGGLLLSN